MAVWLVVCVLLLQTTAHAQRNNNINNNRNDIQSSWSRGELCNRQCNGGDTRICYFEFNVERYTVLGPACRNCSQGNTADCWAPQCVTATGFVKGILTINRQVPGPAIQVCRGDMIVVDVVNRMADHTTSIHWHGIRQLGTPHMDGVPMITQCPINPFTTFRYRFTADEAGTFFYHSHTGAQKLDGINGALIVREPRRNDIHGHLYDEDRPDHVIFLQDWIHWRGGDFSPGLHRQDVDQVPDALLINGIGPLTWDTSHRFLPMANFTVQSRRRYRFRVIAATCMTCSIALKIEGHRMLAISADGALNFKPTPVDTIHLNSADRFDFILETNQTSGNYYIFAQSVSDICRDVRQVAVLRYVSNANSVPMRRAPPPTGSLGVQLNPANATCDVRTNSEICIHHLNGEEHAPSVNGRNGPYIMYHVAFGFYMYDLDDLFAPGTYQHYEEPIYGRLIKSLANNISFTFPPSPMLTQWNDIPRSSLCDRNCYLENVPKACSCSNVYRVPLNSIVDLIVFDTGERDGFSHPFHLHGYNFYVLSMGTFTRRREDRQRQLDEISRNARTDNINLRLRPQRDTINIPARGYAVLRFLADNPGYWLFHCHFAYHLESGMAAVYKVGEDNQIPTAPRGFPTCGNFLN